MTRTRRLQSAAFGLAFSGILALAACGGDDSSSDTTKVDATATTVNADPAGTTSADESTDDTSADDTVGDSTDTTFDTSDIEPLSEDECRDLYDKFNSLGFDLNSADAPEDIDAAFDAIRDAVPDDLKDDVDTLADAYSKLQDIDTSSPDVTDPKYLEALEALSAVEVQEASARLSAYFENCDAATSGD